MTKEAKKRRYWVVRHSYYVIHEVPADWNEQNVGFFYNESSHCADNEAVQIGLTATVGEHVCATCSHHQAWPMKGFDSEEEAAEWRDKDGITAMAKSPRARLDSLRADEILSEEEFAAELARLEAIEKLL